jgi:hypothetical protein
LKEAPMKFTRLVDKFEKLVFKHEHGRKVKSRKLEKLQQLLDRKRLDYQSKIEILEDPEKRKKLETRLRVVEAQLEKTRHLASRDSP